MVRVSVSKYSTYMSIKWWVGKRFQGIGIIEMGNKYLIEGELNRRMSMHGTGVGARIQKFE
jgi:hypothetical protein